MKVNSYGPDSETNFSSMWGCCMVVCAVKMLNNNVTFEVRPLCKTMRLAHKEMVIFK